MRIELPPRRLGLWLGLLAAAFLAAAQPAPGPASQTDTGPADPLLLGPSDVRLEQRGDPGYHLFIRWREGLGSVLLVESTRDPARHSDSYAYRDSEWRAVNGDERRLLGGTFLPSGPGNYWLIDSSPEPDPQFGRALHIFLPWVVEWGRAWSRSGRSPMLDGSFVNLRAFARPYADYGGAWRDNPFVLRMSQAPLPKPLAAAGGESTAVVPAPGPGPKPSGAKPPPDPPEPADSRGTGAPAAPASPPRQAAAVAASFAPPAHPELYLPETLAAYARLAAANGGELRYANPLAKGGGDLGAQLGALIDRRPGDLDLVLCVDTTDSMRDDLEALRRDLPPLFEKELAGGRRLRVGLCLFKDYFEEYLAKTLPFVDSPSLLAEELASIRTGGGRDIPEAVLEGLSASLLDFEWAAPRRLLVLLGDAPPHPIPRGAVTEESLAGEARARGVEIDALALPP